MIIYLNPKAHQKQDEPGGIQGSCSGNRKSSHSMKKFTDWHDKKIELYHISGAAAYMQAALKDGHPN